MKKYKRKKSKKHKSNKKAFIVMVFIGIVIAIVIGVYFTIDGYYFNYLSDTKKIAYSKVKLASSILESEINISQKKYEWSEKLKYDNSPTKIIVHHTAGDKLTPEQIHEDHKNKGYDGIGYHYYIRKSGEIYKGRPDDAEGAHTIGENRKSISICLEGNFEKQKITQDQNQSLINLCKYLIIKYNLGSVIGHNDSYNTLCPGKNISIEEINKELTEYFLKI